MDIEMGAAAAIALKSDSMVSDSVKLTDESYNPRKRMSSISC